MKFTPDNEYVGYKVEFRGNTVCFEFPFVPGEKNGNIIFSLRFDPDLGEHRLSCDKRGEQTALRYYEEIARAMLQPTD